jgi:hypothetical protein
MYFHTHRGWLQKHGGSLFFGIFFLQIFEKCAVTFSDILNHTIWPFFTAPDHIIDVIDSRERCFLNQTNDLEMSMEPQQRHTTS